MKERGLGGAGRQREGTTRVRGTVAENNLSRGCVCLSVCFVPWIYRTRNQIVLKQTFYTKEETRSQFHILWLNRICLNYLKNLCDALILILEGKKSPER